MRTRKSNRTRHFHQFLDPSPSDDEVTPGRKKKGKDDEEFDDEENKAASKPTQEIGVESDDAANVLDGNGGSDGEGDGDDGAGGYEDSPAQNRARRVRRSQGNEAAHQIQPYSYDPRVTIRHYTGPMKRYARFRQLFRTLYGQSREHLGLIVDLNRRWEAYPVLPAGFAPDHSSGVLPSPWVPAGFEQEEQRRWLAWFQDQQAHAPDAQRKRRISSQDGRQLLLWAEGDLLAFLGPQPRQKAQTFQQGSGISLAPSGLGLDDINSKSQIPTGWMFDVRGIALSMAWVPQVATAGQVLAIAVAPFADQADYASREEAPPAGDQRNGAVQFWQLPSEETNRGVRRPSAKAPVLVGAICFDWGRVKSMKWCPIPVPVSGMYGILALLCGDGQVRVVEVWAYKEDTEPQFDWIDRPMATLGITTDYNVRATCLTWVSTNRITLGHSDGSVTLWSIYPQRLLQRHGVHTTHVLEIHAAYPSHPYLVATVPVSGCTTLTDLTRPSAEATFVPTPGTAFQPGLLAWSEHLQGYLGLWPASTPYNTTLAMLHHRYFALPKSVFSGHSLLTCLDVGTVHPFLLVGCADGSLWACNALGSVLREKSQMAWKIKLFEHEFRPVEPGSAGQSSGSKEAPLRGAVRILQGFVPEENRNAKAGPGHKKREPDEEAEGEPEQRPARAKATPKKTSKKKGESAEDVTVEGAGGADGDAGDAMAGRIVMHEPLTRITSVAWNPNAAFGCWAAVAMGSGLVRVMDLGVER